MTEPRTLSPAHNGGEAFASLSDADLYFFDTCGYCVLKGFLDEYEVKRYRGVLGELWPATALKSGLRRLNGLASLAPELRELAEALARRGIYSLISQPFRLIESYAHLRLEGSAQALHNGRSTPNRSELGASSRTMWREHTYHDGRLYCMMVKALVYLTDVHSLEDAPFCVVSGSHKANFPFPGDISDPGLLAMLPPSQLTSVYVDAGDVLLLNEAALHGTHPKLSPDPRIFMAFSYSPSFVADYKALPKTGHGIWDTGHCE